MSDLSLILYSLVFPGPAGSEQTAAEFSDPVDGNLQFGAPSFTSDSDKHRERREAYGFTPAPSGRVQTERDEREAESVSGSEGTFGSQKDKEGQDGGGGGGG